MRLKLQEVYDALFQSEKVKNQTDFANKVDYGRSYISEMMDKEIPRRLEDAIRKAFSLDDDWFDTLKAYVKAKNGAPVLQNPAEVMLVGKQPPFKVPPVGFSAWKGLPMYNVPITASFIETYRDQAYYQPAYYLQDARFKDCNFGTIVTGDSMHSEIRHGDHVICQEILDKSFIVYGDIYYVVASNGLETCKYVNADLRNEDNVMLVARNENISPSPIPKTMIKRLFKVKGVLRAY